MVGFVRAALVGALLEGIAFYSQMIVENARWNGAKNVLPHVLPYASSPLTELMVIASAGALYALQTDLAMTAFSVSMAAHFGTYVWVETGLDAVSLMLMIFLVPGAGSLSPHAYMLLLVLQLLQPWRQITMDLVFGFLQAVCVIASMFLYHTTQLDDIYRVDGAILLCIVALELAAFGYVRRAHGPRAMPSPKNKTLHFVLFNLILGVKRVEASQWRNAEPVSRTGLPESARGVAYFCNSNLIRAVRIHTGRVAPDGRVSIFVGEWDEMAFALNPMGFVLALLFSLRLPLSLRATLDEGGELSDIRLVVFFVETPRFVWDYLTTQTRSTDDSCIVDNRDVFVGGRMTLRRVTKLIVSFLLLYYWKE
tara:strand:- start:4268 stop:5365 length:1098 start_codon:yes stop_codon:yes gene_type:complete